MNKRAIVVLMAVLAAPLAAAIQPSSADAAECGIGEVRDGSYSGTTLVTLTKDGSTVGARIEQTFGRVRFVEEGSTLHSMLGTVSCEQDPNPNDNPPSFVQQVTQWTEGAEVNINCPAGLVGRRADALLRETKSSCGVGGSPD